MTRYPDVQELESSGPQAKRLVIWVVACLLVFIGWGYIAPRRPIPPPAQVPTAEAPVPESAAAAQMEGADPEFEGEEIAAPEEPSIGEDTPRRVVAAVPGWELELSNVGGRLTSWKLLDVGDYGDPTRPLELVRRRITDAADGAPLVQGGALAASDEQEMLPLQVISGDPDLDARLAGALHEVRSQSRAGRKVLSARWSDGAGTSVEKILTLREDQRLATLEARLTVDGRPVPFRLAWGPGISNHTSTEHSNLYFRRGQVAWLAAGKVRTAERPDKQDELPETPVSWAAMQDSYFTVVFTPASPAGQLSSGGPHAGFRIGGQVPLDEKGRPNKRAWPEEIVLEVPFTPDAPIQAVHAGPRDRKALQALDATFERPPRLAMITHLGMLDGLGRLLHAPLVKFHDWTGSWGWSVVLLTLLVRIVIAPLQFISMKKMRGMADKMRPMQAKLKALDERYKRMPPTRENRMKQMQEKQELMMAAGVNPADTLSGCLPLLITMPVFFALFKLIPNAPEFRHESFLAWSDLAAADPSHVLPILAAVLTFISTKMGMSSSPQAIDPMQRNMLYMFPLMLVWLCWSAPLAFVVYQVAMSGVQIGQQWLFNLALPPVAAAPAPARTRSEADKPEPRETSAAVAAGPVAARAASRKKGRKR